MKELIVIIIGIAIALYLLIIYPKSLKRKYDAFLENGDKKEAIAAGRKYYSFGKMLGNSAAELRIQNGLKSHGLD